MPVIPHLSVIVPAYNEADCLPMLAEALLQTLRPLNDPFEIIFVNDASTDSTGNILQELSARHPEIRGVHHTANCGQSAAILSGMEAAAGQIFITLDADMQNPPEEIPQMLRHLDPETDAVCGIRTRRSDNAIRRLSSVIANAFRNRITGVPVQDAGCGLKIIRREAARELPAFNGLHRFLTTCLKLQGFTVKEVPIRHQPRPAGISKYGIQNRLWRGIADCFAMRWYAKRVLPARRVTCEKH
ncbi:MAG: glycosyltransferase family 2 protein [Kiritimatiellales bacterium]